MENLDRIVVRPGRENGPDAWFFKASEGLMGPFDSHETAKRKLEEFVARCKAAARHTNECE